MCLEGVCAGNTAPLSIAIYKNASLTMDDFSTVDTDTYIKYIEKAQWLHNLNLHIDKDEKELAELLWKKDNSL